MHEYFSYREKKQKYKSGILTCCLVHSHSLVLFETFNSVNKKGMQ